VHSVCIACAKRVHSHATCAWDACRPVVDSRNLLGRPRLHEQRLPRGAAPGREEKRRASARAAGGQADRRASAPGVGGARLGQAARAARARARAGVGRARQHAELVHVVLQRPRARHQRARQPAPRAQPVVAFVLLKELAPACACVLATSALSTLQERMQPSLPLNKEMSFVVWLVCADRARMPPPGARLPAHDDGDRRGCSLLMLGFSAGLVAAVSSFLRSAWSSCSLACVPPGHASSHAARADIPARPGIRGRAAHRPRCR